MPPEVTGSLQTLSLANVAARATSVAEFENQLRDYVRALRELSLRAGVAATIADEPSLLAGRFADDGAADVQIAACARLIAAAARIPVPSWAAVPVRGGSTTTSRLSIGEADRALPVEITLGIRRGRPSVSIEHKRRTNAERQRRFRARRAAEWREFRRTAGRERVPPAPSPPVRPDITLDLQTLP